jgi:hypothetical protein
VRRWVRKIARLMDSPDIESNLERLVAAQLPARKERPGRRKQS